MEKKTKLKERKQIESKRKYWDNFRLQNFHV